jgi:hypothetical protein
MLRIPHCLDNRLTDGGKVVSPTHRPLLYSPETLFLSFWYIIRIIKSRRMRWAGHVARMGEKRNVYRLLVGKPEGKRPLGRPRRRWIDNIKMYILEIGLSVVDMVLESRDIHGVL